MRGFHAAYLVLKGLLIAGLLFGASTFVSKSIESQYRVAECNACAEAAEQNPTTLFEFGVCSREITPARLGENLLRDPPSAWSWQGLGVHSRLRYLSQQALIAAALVAGLLVAFVALSCLRTPNQQQQHRQRYVELPDGKTPASSSYDYLHFFWINLVLMAIFSFVGNSLFSLHDEHPSHCAVTAWPKSTMQADFVLGACALLLSVLAFCLFLCLYNLRIERLVVYISSAACLLYGVFSLYMAYLTVEAAGLYLHLLFASVNLFLVFDAMLFACCANGGKGKGKAKDKQRRRGEDRSEYDYEDYDDYYDEEDSLLYDH